MWTVSATCHQRSRSLTEHQGGALQGGSAHDNFVQDDREAYGNLAEVHDGHAHTTKLHPDPPLDNGLRLQAIDLCPNWDSNRAGCARELLHALNASAFQHQARLFTFSDTLQVEQNSRWQEKIDLARQ